jgi:hypothetical protein
LKVSQPWVVSLRLILLCVLALQVALAGTSQVALLAPPDCASFCFACFDRAAGFAAHQRGKALEALLWFSQLNLPLTLFACCLCNCVAAGFAAHQRGKALEALLWFSQLPSSSRRPAPLVSPRQIIAWMSSGALQCQQIIHLLFFCTSTFVLLW